MGIVFKNNAKTTLASSLSNSATSATVTDGAVFPSLSAGEHFLITFDDGSNNEICKCTARSGNTLTIVRAQESTTARAFSSGDAAEGRVTAGVLETIQENIAAKSANQTVFNATTSGNATTYNIGVNPGVEANAMVFLNGVLQHHDTISFSGVNLTFDAAPPNGMALEVIVDNLINLQSSNLTVDSFTAADVGGSPQTAFTLSDSPAAETNLIVFVEGVFQDQDAYTISSNTLTITTGVIAGRGVTVYIINPVNIGTPSDGTVTSAKLSGNITTPGTLTVGSHDVAFDSPTFVVDNANSRVGLGTASPSVPVDIVGDVKMSANLTVDTSTLVVDSTNNRVGIGTTSPGRTLDVNGIIRSDGTSGALAFGGNSSTPSEGVAIHRPASDTMAFVTASTERMRIDSAGLVSMTHAAGAHTGGLSIINSQAGGYGSSLTFQSERSDDNSIVSAAQIRTQGQDSWNSAASADSNLFFATALNGSLTDKMVIKHDGAVGIRQTAPATTLHIGDGASHFVRIENAASGDVSSGYQIYRGASTLGAQLYDNPADNATTLLAAGKFNILTGGSGIDFHIDTSGKVGIGETTPDDTLHVNASGGTARLRIGSGNDAYYTSKGYLGDTWYFGSGETGDVVTSTISGGAFTSSNAGGAFVWKTDNSGTLSEKMRIRSDGVVTTPEQCYFLAVRTTNLSGYNFSATSGATTTIFTSIVSAQSSASGTAAFSTTDGTFSAPVDGLYLFHFSFYSNVTIEQAWLTSNGARINYTDVTANTSATTAGTVFNGSIQYYMTAGASIRIHPYSAGSSSDYVYDNVYHTYWKGVLLG